MVELKDIEVQCPNTQCLHKWLPRNDMPIKVCPKCQKKFLIKWARDKLEIKQTEE